MLQTILKFLIGGKSKRYRFMVIYALIFVILTLAKKLDPIAFATFTAAFMGWLGVETIKQGSD